MNVDNKKSKKIDVMWVGLSNKKSSRGENFYPLEKGTNSGKIIAKIEKQFPKLNFYKTNLVRFAPVDKNNKLRYPTILEMEEDFHLLQKDVSKLKPKITFLLGSKVTDFVLKKNAQKLTKSKDSWRAYCGVHIKEVHFISIFHPSYIYVYKRKEINDYVKVVRQIILDLT